MSPYARMRDPLENRELTFGAAGWGDDAQAQELMEDIVDHIFVYRDQTRLLSFTIDAVSGYTEGDAPFMRAWARARMWEQYATNHAGVRIAFDLQRVGSHLLAELQRLGAVGPGAVALHAGWLSKHPSVHTNPRPLPRRRPA